MSDALIRFAARVIRRTNYEQTWHALDLQTQQKFVREFLKQEMFMCWDWEARPYFLTCEVLQSMELMPEEVDVVACNSICDAIFDVRLSSLRRYLVELSVDDWRDREDNFTDRIEVVLGDLAAYYVRAAREVDEFDESDAGDQHILRLAADAETPP